MTHRMPIAALLVFFSNAAGTYAADTTETYGTGVVDLEIYAGGGGPAASSHVFAMAHLGYGLYERLSACTTVVLAAQAGESVPQTDILWGLLGTPLDTHHFDLDV